MSEPIWLAVARFAEGISEIPGLASEPVIVKWAKDIGAPAYTSDEIAWCAVFANRVAMTCGFPFAGTSWDLLRAKSFATWGIPLMAPALGAWMVFKRPEGHHVGWYLGQRANGDYRILGGNTGNAVAATWIDQERLIATRWPGWSAVTAAMGAAVALPILKRIALKDDGQPVSGNEA